MALGATCLAYGIHLNLGQLIFVNTAASVLSGLVPVPGGIGAAEAALSAGLIAMGVDESTAFAIAVTQRLCTFYLPPIWGYFSLRWLSQKGYCLSGNHQEKGSRAPDAPPGPTRVRFVSDHADKR